MQFFFGLYACGIQLLWWAWSTVVVVGVVYSYCGGRGTSSQDNQSHQVGGVVLGMKLEQFAPDVYAQLSRADLKCVLVSCKGKGTIGVKLGLSWG